MAIQLLFLEYCSQDLFKIEYSILLLFPSIFFSMCFVSIDVVHPYISMQIAPAWKKNYIFFLLD